MKVITGMNTAEQFHRWIDTQRDSHMAVLLRSGERAERFWESEIVTGLRLHCQVERILWETPEELTAKLSVCKLGESAGGVRMSKRKNSVRLLAFGGLYELQEICVARAWWQKRNDTSAGNKRVPLLFVTQDMIPAAMLPGEVLWVRNRDGVPRYFGSFQEGAADTVVMPPVRGQAKRFYDLFVKMEEETGDLMWKELAEPLWLRYGVPEYLAGLLALRYVYRVIQGKDFMAMEKLLTQKMVPVRDMVWIAREDIMLLSEMAMAGIEMLPQQERLSWQQIKAFYISLCR